MTLNIRFENWELLPKLPPEEILFACIGTDRSTGDCLGPFVGMLLQQKGYNVVGTLEKPLHAEVMHEPLTSDKVIIAIDSALGNFRDVGVLEVRKEPLIPGIGVGKDLPEIGDYSILGCVNIGMDDALNLFILGNTRFYNVYQMANALVDKLQSTYPVHGDK